MLFPSTPIAENQMRFAEGEPVPVVQLIQSSAAAPKSSMTVLPPAFWDPAPTSQTRVETECVAQVPASQGPPPQGPPQGPSLAMPPQGQTPPIPPQGSPQGLPQRST